MATTTKIPGKPRTTAKKDLKGRFRQGASKATPDSVPSKSSQKERPEPRGVREKTQSALQRRIDDMGGVKKRQQGNHQMHVPGSQNRKKGYAVNA